MGIPLRKVFKDDSLEVILECIPKTILFYNHHGRFSLGINKKHNCRYQARYKGKHFILFSNSDDAKDAIICLLSQLVNKQIINKKELINTYKQLKENG